MEMFSLKDLKRRTQSSLVFTKSVEDVEQLFGDSVIKWKAILLKLNICVSSATGGMPVISEP